MPDADHNERKTRTLSCFILVFVLMETLQVTNRFFGIWSPPTSVGIADLVGPIFLDTMISLVGASACAFAAWSDKRPWK